MKIIIKIVTAGRQTSKLDRKEINLSFPNELLDGMKNRFSLFLGCMNQAPSKAEQFGSIVTTERTGHFLFHFRHSDIPFGLIVIKTNLLMSQKC